MDLRLYDSVSAWLSCEWPFENVAYPGRGIDWPAWEAIADEKR